MSEKIQIRMEAYDHEALDQSGVEIVDTAKRTGARVTGPIPLPTRIERYTVLRSPFIDKKSREQFEIRTHKRLIYISEPTPQTIDSLSSLNLPAGVDIRIKALTGRTGLRPSNSIPINPGTLPVVIAALPSVAANGLLATPTVPSFFSLRFSTPVVSRAENSIEGDNFHNHQRPPRGQTSTLRGSPCRTGPS